MNETYGEWYHELKDALGSMQDNFIFDDMTRLVNSGKSTVSLNRKLMEKSIDVSWVEAIENGLIHVDNVVRNPSRTIIDVEEVVPIALSKKITVDSVKHLAQHTDLIQSIDKKTGKITPSKILNVHKEESLATYENRFVNTLIDRLYIFIMKRYEKLSQIDKDEEVFVMDFTNELDDKQGNVLAVKFSIDAKRSLETTNDSGYTIWQRVEKLKKTIEGYKGSELCVTLGNNFVRPPIMRTNAIMKNVDLKACLALWQYILSYDKVGYEINVEDTALNPEEEYVTDMQSLMACNLLLFRSFTDDGLSNYKPLEKKKLKPVQPKVVKRYRDELLSGHYNLHADEEVGFVTGEGGHSFINKVPEESDDIFEAINSAIELDREYYIERDKKHREEMAIQEEAERRRQERQARLEEKRRIEEARREERERARREREEEEKRRQEMLARRQAEIEAEQRERERIEAERQAKREEERRLAEEEARIAAEKAKLESEKKAIRNELGDAEGINTDIIDKKKASRDVRTAYSTITANDMDEAAQKIEDDAQAREDAAAAVEEAKASGDEYAIEEAEKAQEKVNKEEVIEDPREVAARMKLEQQKREKENREKARAERLRALRKSYEEKPFKEIRKDYSWNPVYSIPRFFKWLFFVLFGIIPKDTDNPDQKRILVQREELRKKEEYERGEREKFEVYYKKYASNFPYNIERFIDDQKFKAKKRKQAKENSKPKPKFTPPERTPEEQKALDLEMKNLYKTYHVGLVEKIKRRIEEYQNRKIQI